MKNDWAFIWMVSILSFTLGFGLGHGISTKTKQTQAIERGFAEYNSTNGVWQWKESQR